MLRKTSVILAGQLPLTVIVTVMDTDCPGPKVSPQQGLNVAFAPLLVCCPEKLVYPWFCCVKVTVHINVLPDVVWQLVPHFRLPGLVTY